MDSYFQRMNMNNNDNNNRNNNYNNSNNVNYAPMDNNNLNNFRTGHEGLNNRRGFKTGYSNNNNSNPIRVNQRNENTVSNRFPTNRVMPNPGVNNHPIGITNQSNNQNKNTFINNPSNNINRIENQFNTGNKSTKFHDNINVNNANQNKKGTSKKKTFNNVEKGFNKNPKDNEKEKSSYLNFKFLESNTKLEINEVVENYIKITDLKATINNTKYTDDMILVQMKNLHKLSESNSECVKMIIKHFLISFYLNDLINYLDKNCSKKELASLLLSGKKDDFFEFLMQTCEFFTNISVYFKSFQSKFPVKELQNVLEKLIPAYDKGSRESEIIRQISLLFEKLKSNLSHSSINDDEIDLNAALKRKRIEIKDIPIDYVEEPIEISQEELLCQIRKDIEPHRDVGSYDSWERYINTLFYLTREDCYRSLRENFEIIANNDLDKISSNFKLKKKLSDVYYYKEIKFESIQCNVYGIILSIEIDLKISNIRVLGNKRLLHGSLVILTDKNFETVLFCLVKEVDKNQTKKNASKLLIKLEFLNPKFEEIRKIMNLSNTSFQMFESKAFYQAYCHIMKRLKSFRVNNLPFKDIVVNFNLNDYNTNRAKYVPHYSLRSMQYENSFFNPSKGQWPESLVKSLDLSQMSSIKYALLNKIALIQGPPGTGKTFVGNLICKLLLKNTENPILVVCYTNHALDQFLTQILRYEEKVIRIGGRCKEEDLMKLTLLHKRNNDKSRLSRKTERMALFKLRTQIKNLTSEIESHLNVINKRTGLNFETIKLYFPILAERIFEEFSHEIKKNIKKQKVDLFGILSEFKEKIILAWMNIYSVKKLIDEILYKLFLDDKKTKNSFESFIKTAEKDASEDYINECNKDFDGNEEDDFSYEELSLDDDQEENMDRVMFDHDNSDDDDADENNHRQRNDYENSQNMFFDEEFLKKKQNKIQLNKDTNFFHYNLINTPNIWMIGKNIRYRMLLVMKQIIWDSLEDYSDKLEQLQDLIKSKSELEDLQDLEIIKSHRIVGMTTTGCAKYSNYLDNINFETVIIEEAAEVVESHLFSLFTKNSKHLIMIGDHQQLRPKIYNYEIEKKYKFDVSMFERLINNNYPYVSLTTQRRMRPEFAEFVRLIYGDSYVDHISTNSRENIKGFHMDDQANKNMIFFNHKNLEGSSSGLSSKENKFEAEFIAYLSRFLLQQTIPPEKITILTFYVAQVVKIKECLKKIGLSSIRISSVDNYQGEENDYIILSLVRSNEQNSIGFLKIRNRVCVAFSRVKIGFFVIGNFDFLRKASQIELSKPSGLNTANKNLWEEIYNLAKKKNILKEELQICCQKHKNIISIKSPKDFENIPEGGCKEVCKERMECGHLCELFCHNFPHENNIKCIKPCARIIESCGHKCSKKCFEKCGKCFTMVEKTLNCGHKIKAACHHENESLKCMEKCSRSLTCGHLCKKLCIEKCDQSKCEELTEKQLICGHRGLYPCNMPAEICICKEKCGVLIDGCQHPCQGTCGECMQGTLHLKCQKVCDRVLVCGHVCKKSCFDNCLCNEKCENTCWHGSCENKCMSECTPCNEFCQDGCSHRKCDLICSETCTRDPCNIRCEKLLSCKHRCMGLCGEECPKICKTCDPDNDAFQIYFGNEDDEDALFYELECRHVIEVQALDRWTKCKDTFKRPNCPKCKSNVKYSKRYSSEIKYFYDQLNKIKKIYLRDIDREYQSRNYLDEIKADLSELNQEFRIREGYHPHFNNFIKTIDNLGKKDYDLLISAKNLLTILHKLLIIENEYGKVVETVKSSLLFRYFNNNYLSVIRRFEKLSFIKNQDLNDLTRKVDCIFYSLKILQQYNSFKNTGYERIMLDSKLMIRKDEQLNTFKNMLGEIKTKNIIEIMNVMGGMRWYVCPNGHPYSVGECGRPMQESACPQCGLRIGGLNHNLDINNREYRPNN